jgi:DNA (cytosine-5)-methyltransferase 1
MATNISLILLDDVPPWMARAIGQEILKAQGIQPTKPRQVLQLGDEGLLSLDMSAAAQYFKVPRDTIAQRSRVSLP